MGLFRRNRIWWMCFMYQGRQVRRTTKTSDKRLAERILAHVKADIVEGQYFERREENERTVDELLGRYVREHAVKKASCRAITGYARNLLAFFGGKTLAQVTPRIIAEYKAKRYADGVRPATINRDLAIFKHAFNLAIREWEWCRENPVKRVSMERERNQRDRWLTSAEESRLLAACSAGLSEIVTFALHTGMRIGEITALTWEGVDLTRQTATIFHSKNGEPRTLPLNAVALSIVTKKAEERASLGNRVFPARIQTPGGERTLRRAFQKAVRTAGLHDFRFHDLRHTFATRLVQDGEDLYRVQRLLGHKSPTMTQRYAHHCSESLRVGVNRLVSTELAQGS